MFSKLPLLFRKHSVFYFAREKNMVGYNGVVSQNRKKHPKTRGMRGECLRKRKGARCEYKQWYNCKFYLPKTSGKYYSFNFINNALLKQISQLAPAVSFLCCALQNVFLQCTSDSFKILLFWEMRLCRAFVNFTVTVNTLQALLRKCLWMHVIYRLGF